MQNNIEKKNGRNIFWPTTKGKNIIRSWRSKENELRMIKGENAIYVKKCKSLENEFL